LDIPITIRALVSCLPRASASAPKYNVQDDVFMVIEFKPGALRKRPGVVRYHPAFAAL
jgi:predicted N-acetyltransferase YhbS